MPVPNLLQKYGIEAGPAKIKGVPDLIGTKYNNFAQEPAPAPLPQKPGILGRIGGAIKTGISKASEFLAGAAEEPTYTGAKGEVLRNLPGEIVRTILPGAAALQAEPELAAEITNRDILREVPGAVLETGKELLVKPPIRGAVELPNLLTLGKLKPEINFKIPGIGEIKNSDYRIAERIANGEDLGAIDITLEKTTGLLDAIFLVTLARGAFVKRPTTIAKGVRVPPPALGVAEGPRTGQLYTGPKPTQTPIPKEIVQGWMDEGLAFKKPVDPNLPTYFEVSRVGGKDVGKVIQLRPSWFDKLTGAKLPAPIPEPIEVYSREVSAGAIENLKPVVKPPRITPVIPPPTPAAVQPVLPPKRDVTAVTLPPLTVKPQVPLPKQVVPPGRLPQPVAEIRGEVVPTPPQLVTKSGAKDLVKGIGKDSVDFNVEEINGKLYMTYSDPSRNLDIKLRPSALGLVEDNIKPGQTININTTDLKVTGTSFRGVTAEGGVEASLADDLSDAKLPATTPGEFVKRIQQLNKFGQSYAILRRTGALPKKAAGIFRHGKKAPKKGIVHLQDMTVKQASQYMSTLAHELGHALDFTFNQGKMDNTLAVFGRDLTADQKKILLQELKAVTDNLVGEAVAKKAPGYYYKKQELLARFLEKMFVSPGNLKELAPTAIDLFEKSAVESPIISEYLEAVRGNIDLGERKNIFLRDMRQTYIEKLGTRVGNIAWNNEVRYRSMKERAKFLMEKLVKDKFKNVDDDPELLFRAAESIKVTTKNVPEFGTRDFQYAKDEKEVAKLVENGYEPILNERGNRPVEWINGEEYTRYAKVRYTPEQGKAFYEALSPEGKKLINDFTASKEDSVDYFNREVIKDVNKINSNIEGWVHHYWEDKPVGVGGKQLQFKVAASKRERKGAEGYVEDLQKAMTKALTELETEKAYNNFIEDYFAQVTKPIGKGEEPEKGWIEVTGDVRKGGVGTPQEMRTIVITKGKAVPVQRARYQMPKTIYQRFQKIKEVADEASTAMRIVNNLNRYWRVNILFAAGSAATNFISGGVQYSAKVLTDFYTEVLSGNLSFEKTRKDIYSMLTVLMPRGWQGAPDWVYGGDMSNFYGQFGIEKTPGIEILDKSIDAYADKALYAYSAIERYWKKVIATSENVSDLKSLNVITKEGLKLPTEAEKEILDFINSEVDLFAYDYDNVPSWLANYQQNPGWQAIKPFAKYPYKYAKHVTEMVGAAFDGTLPWQERVAKILALGTLMAIYAYIREKQKEKSKTPAVPESAPASVSTRGRLYIRTDEKGRELFTRVAKYPFINLTEAGAQFIEGNTAQGVDLLNDMVGSIAPAGDIALALMGYSSEYDQYTPFPVRAGKQAASFVPGTRILSDIARFFDPYQRKQQTLLQGFTSFYPTTDPALQEKLRGEIRTIQVPLEGGVKPALDIAGEGTRRTTTDMFVRNYKNDILLGLLAGIYINRIDPSVAEAFKIRKEKNVEKEEKKGKLNPFYSQ